MNKSAHRHCLCATHLIETLMGLLVQSGADPKLLQTLAANKGKVLRSCPGTTLPNIQWDAVGKKFEELIAGSIRGILEEEEPEDQVGEVAEKLAGVISRSVRGMWEVTLLGADQRPDLLRRIN